MILLTPGPCMTSDTVRLAGAARDYNHREPEFQELIGEVRRRLVELYAGSASWHPYLIGGSGTAAVEAMLASCIGEGKVLVLENGYYSGRLKDKLAVHGIPHDVLSFDWLSPIDLARVESAVSGGEFEAVVATHNETTTGRLNDIAAIGEVAVRHGARLLVDAMSSFGVEEIPFGVVDAVCSSANKCLHGVPGVSFVLASPEIAGVLPRMPRRSHYLSLPMYEGHVPPLTPPVPAMASLRQALRENPGTVARRTRYSELQTRLRSELARRGFEPAIPLEESSVTLTTYRVPGEGTSDGWLEANRREGYMLYGCKGPLRDDFFQVSVMGEVSDAHVEGWLAAVDRILS